MENITSQTCNTIQYIVQYLPFISPVLNPVVYLFLSETFENRNAFKNKLSKIFFSKNPKTAKISKAKKVPFVEGLK